MQTLALIWLQFHAAQERVKETFAQSPPAEEELRPNSSPAVAQPDAEIGGKEADPISPEAIGKERR
jgi:hypothetical protein